MRKTNRDMLKTLSSEDYLDLIEHGGLLALITDGENRPVSQEEINEWLDTVIKSC